MPTNTAEAMTRLQEVLDGIRSGGEILSSVISLNETKSGGAISPAHLTKIKRFTRTDQDTENLYTFPVLMIDEAPTRNRVLYTGESQKKSAKSWAGTPYLFNSMGTNGGGLFGGSADHTLQAASQIARIYDARAVETPNRGIGTLGWVYTVTGTPRTEEFKALVEGGVLSEVSIHVQVPEGVICSICNDAFGNCEKKGDKIQHYPGETYGKKTCFMSTGTGKLTPLELSQVACPGSVEARILGDDDVEDYHIVPLKEALVGTREVINLHPLTENTMDKNQARAKLTELATAAGVKISEMIVKPEHKTLTETADATNWPEAKETTAATTCEKCKTEHAAGTECAKATCDKCKVEHTIGAECAKPKATALFEGDCPVCLRKSGPTTSGTESEQVAQIKSQFQESVGTVVTEANSKIAAAEAKGNEFKTKAEERDALLSDFVEMTVQEAIDKGQKKEIDRTPYRETLKTLSYAALKEIRSTLASIKKPTTEEATEQLRVGMEERARRDLGTRVETKDGVTQTTRRGRALFAT